MIFHFVVRRLRWLAHLPVVPHIFDALLLTWTALFHRERMAAMELLESRTLELPGVHPRRHRFGGIGFVRAGKEFAHLHGNGLLDVHLTRESAEALVARGHACPHHLFGPSAWISFWVRAPNDLPDALNLLRQGAHLD